MIEFLVLVDRGHRELPIKADFIGKNIPTAKTQDVKVMMVENDNEDGIYLVSTDEEETNQ